MTLAIDMVSDVVCPWCYIGKHRLEKAMALRPHVPVEVRFRPYFLNPWVPREGMSREEYLTTKFGSPERYRGCSRGRGTELCTRQDRPPAQYARLPSTDSMGRRDRVRRQREAAAYGALFRRGRRSVQSRCPGRGGGRLRTRWGRCAPSACRRSRYRSDRE